MSFKTCTIGSRTLVAGMCLLFAVPAYAVESILSYHSDITVSAEGSMDVVETIRVRAEGQNIRRGIYRDFPTDYEDQYGNSVHVDFQVLGVLRDGAAEAYHQEPRSNGIRVYAGSANYFLPAGEYIYTIHYRTDRQLGFFDTHDELYWNVTGNGWAFAIEDASASVRLPDGVPQGSVTIEGYTGRFGSRQQAYETEVRLDGTAHIRVTRVLQPGEALTLVVMWPKGFVVEPSLSDKVENLLIDNLGLLMALTALFLVAVYLFYAWYKVGRDPDPGVIFPHYVPPEGFSPASVRFIAEMGYDHRTFAAAVINLAVKGFLEIDNTGDDYNLVRERPAPDSSLLAPGEKALLTRLFAEANVLVLENENHRVLLEAMAAHSKALKRNYQKIYFYTNTPILIPSLLLAAGFLGLIAVLDRFTIFVFVVLAVIVILHYVFYHLMKAPTRTGRRLLDKIEGFKSYLEIAEKDELNLRNPPDKTPELFEQYLPYALAMEVEQDWSEKFATVLASIRNPDGSDYQPNWYHGQFNAARLGNFASDVGSSLSSAISSASTAPGSSSGGGGGGFSGGGGGGGGGGGW